jgi:hypothetical protein
MQAHKRYKVGCAEMYHFWPFSVIMKGYIIKVLNARDRVNEKFGRKVFYVLKQEIFEEKV